MPLSETKVKMSLIHCKQPFTTNHRVINFTQIYIILKCNALSYNHEIIEEMFNKLERLVQAFQLEMT